MPKIVYAYTAHAPHAAATVSDGRRNVRQAARAVAATMQMVANGLGMTLLPELAVPLEAQRGDIHLMRFADPEPQRTIGLAWRRSSPRKHHFVELGKMVEAARGSTGS